VADSGDNAPRERIVEELSSFAAHCRGVERASVGVRRTDWAKRAEWAEWLAASVAAPPPAVERHQLEKVAEAIATASRSARSAGRCTDSAFREEARAALAALPPCPHCMSDRELVEAQLEEAEWRRLYSRVEAENERLREKVRVLRQYARTVDLQAADAALASRPSTPCPDCRGPGTCSDSLCPRCGGTGLLASRPSTETGAG
jgi:hypothetical protein